MFGRSLNRFNSQDFSQWTAVAVVLCQVAVAVSSVAISGEGEWSSWSACSSSCGQGIASRSRDCARESITAGNSRTCRGRSSQVKICLLQDCPRDRPAARELACSHYNSRVFSGKRYSWEPFIHPTDPCKLTCRAKGVHFYANLPARLEDGEPCSTGQTRAVCLKGLCQVVGCDDVVASQAVKDKCGVCKGDDSTCKTVSGIFTSTELKRGLNFVLSIPPGSTSINITELMASRNSLILEDPSGQAFINGDTKSPTSGDVTAAGAVFAYSARSPTNSRESIVSLGPTSETITLKLLLRDVSPGIIYTFSVPNVIGDTDLRQIIHRRQPVELAPGTGHTSEHQSSLDVKSSLWSASQDDHEDSSDQVTQVDVGVELTTSSVIESTHKVTPTPVTSTQLIFSHISKVDHSNNKTFLASFEGSTQTTQNMEEIFEAVRKETRNVSSDDARSTFVSVEDTEQTDVRNDVTERIEGKTPAGGGNGSYLTSERSDNGSFEVTNTSSMKNSSGKQKPLPGNDVSRGQVQLSDLDRAYLDTPVKDGTTTQTLLAPKIVVVTRHASQYNIPKYSQTFNYNSQPGAQRTQNFRLENSREQDISRPHPSRPGDSLNTRHPQIIEKSSPVRRSEFSRSKQMGPLHFGSLNSGQGDRINAFGTSLNYGSGTQRANRERLERERARAERQRQLQERQILMEERQRRIQQQQELYNKRMREYNEKIQRRAQLIANRQQQFNGARNEYRVPERKPPESQRHDEQRRVNQAESSGSGTVTHETAFHVAITDTGPVVTKLRDQRIESPRDPGGSIIRQHTAPEPTIIALKRGPVFAQPEGLTDETENGSDVRNKDGDYDVNSDLPNKIQHGNDHGNNDDNSRSVTSGQGLDHKSGPRKESNSIEDVSKTSQFGSFNKPGQGQGGETEIAKPPLPPTGQHGDTKEGPFIRIRQSPEPAAPSYIPVASPESSALTGNDIDQSPETISNDLLSTNQISSDYRPTNNEVFASNVLPNQILLTSDQNSRNTAYEWKISGLTQCTQTCGGGAERTLVVCMDTLSQAVVTDENCRHLVKPEVLTFTCNTRPCPAVWTPGPWTPCTVTCGQGEQTRVVTCQARVSPTLNWTMPAESCDHQDKLVTRQTCNNNPCSQWRVGNWSSCSAGCGDGQRSRDVDCVDTANNVVPDEMCTELKPSSEDRCHLGECGKGWLFTDWPEECPAQCGTGRMTRRLFCGDDEGNPLPDNRCDTDQRPADTKSCRTNRPCGGIWFSGQWSECNTTCGLGYKKRDVICIKALSGSVQAVVSDDNCEVSTKPVELDQCQGPVCAPQWYMTSWSECSQSCGTGHKTREVKCLDGAQLPSDNCLPNQRPKTRAPCNTQQCGAITDSSPTKQDLQNPNCEDESPQCSVAQKARMCQYDSYKRMCCKSCAATDDNS